MLWSVSVRWSVENDVLRTWLMNLHTRRYEAVATMPENVWRNELAARLEFIVYWFLKFAKQKTFQCSHHNLMIDTKNINFADNETKINMKGAAHTAGNHFSINISSILPIGRWSCRTANREEICCCSSSTLLINLYVKIVLDWDHLKAIKSANEIGRFALTRPNWICCVLIIPNVYQIVK